MNCHATLILTSLATMFAVVSVPGVRAENVTIAWNANTDVDLAGYNIYAGERSRAYTEVADVGNSTEFDWSLLEAGKTYYFSVTAYDVSGNESSFSDEIKVTVGSDGHRPRIVDLLVLGRTQVDLVFSDRLQSESAENRDNYRISDGVVVQGVVLAESADKVHLLTSAHELGRSYVLFVANVKGLNATQVANGTSQSYRLPATETDATPPVLTAVSVPDLSTLAVTFNEALDPGNAEDPTHYMITKGVQVVNAELKADRRTVKLTTSPHSGAHRFRLTVTDIADLAGNAIRESNTIKYVVGPGTIDNVPPELVSVAVNGATQIDVNFNEAVDGASAENLNHYAIEPNVGVLGAFLGDDARSVHLITEPHKENVEYELSVNGVEDNAAMPLAVVSGNSVRYYFESSSVFDGEEGGVLAPDTFTLFQNYPNPFNPETEIRFFLDRRMRVELQVFNTLGQEVRSLMTDELDAGFHSVVWDGRDDDATPMPSGIYMYSLRVNLRPQAESAAVFERRVLKMTLVR